MILHHGDTETRSKLLHEDLTERVIGAAIEVHRALGPGLLESASSPIQGHQSGLRLPSRSCSRERTDPRNQMPSL